MGFLIVPGQTPAAGQKVKTKVFLYDDYLMTETGEIPLPKNAVEMVQTSVFAFQTHAEYPQNLAQDPSGNVFVTVHDQKLIHKFNASGELLADFRLGKKVQRGGIGLSQIEVPGDQMAVLDDIRLRFLDPAGQIKDQWRIGPIHNFAVDRDGLVYATPVLSDKAWSLVEIFSAKGKSLGSFGKPLDLDYSLFRLNARILAFGQKGEIWVAFTYFPLLRKYSPQGDLLAEYRIDHPVLKGKEKMNLQMLEEGRQNKTQYGYAPLIQAIKAGEGKIYLLTYYPRLEILEMDEEGHLLTSFWRDYDNPINPRDFLVRGSAGHREFFVLLAAPDWTIEVLEPKK